MSCSTRPIRSAILATRWPCPPRARPCRRSPADQLECVAGVVEAGGAGGGAGGGLDHLGRSAPLRPACRGIMEPSGRPALGVLGEPANLLGDNAEALAAVARARRLDGGVEREQVRLLGDAGIVAAMPPMSLVLALRPWIVSAAVAEDSSTSRMGAKTSLTARPPECAASRARCAATTVSWTRGDAPLGRGRDVVGGLADGGRAVHLALGATGDVGDGGGDLRHRAAGLLRGPGHVARGVGHADGAAGDLPDRLGERGARRRCRRARRRACRRARR